MIVDAHQHFWRYAPEEYGWIGPEMGAIARDFMPADLAATLSAAGVAGAVSVQARQTLAETEWLLDLADAHPFLLGVVGWAPLAAPDAGETLARLAERPKLRGVRHVVQDEPDDAFLAGEAFNRGVARLAPLGLTYDLLVLDRQLPQTIAFVDRHPDQPFVLDHLAKPPAKRGELEPWRGNLKRLAERPNVCCKLSGLVTEADWRGWTPEGLHPYLDAALEAFGPRRLMFGSDWPVCLVASDYPRWLHLVRGWAAPMTEGERGALLGGNAIDFYGLRRPDHAAV